MASTDAIDFVQRPFAQLPSEPDWVCLKEVVPAAIGTARTTAEHGSREVIITTVLPDGWAALHRSDGVILLALQVVGGSGDPSRELAAALLSVIDAEPGTTALPDGRPGSGPRLQDVLDLTVPFDATIQDSYRFWLAPDVEVTGDLAAAIEEADGGILPTERLTGVEAAYLTQMGSKTFLRWAQSADEQTVLDGLSRLHAKRESGFDGARFIGYFRASGIAIPVWELAGGVTAAEIADGVADLAARLDVALASTEPLDANERRARSGLVARQVTLR